MLSTYEIAAATSVERQRISRMLHQAGIKVEPGGAGRMPRRTAEDERLDQLTARLYQERRMPSTQIAELTGISEYAVLARLRARGVPVRTRPEQPRRPRRSLAG
jgi:hypothetical protein